MIIKESVWGIIRKLKGNFSISDLTHHDELRGAKYNSIYVAVNKLATSGLITRIGKGRWVWTPNISSTKKPKPKVTGRIEKDALRQRILNNITETIKIDHKFTELNTWKVGDLSRRGFKLIEVSITGQGWPHGEYTNLPPEALKLKGNRKAFILNCIKYRQYRRIEKLKLCHDDFDYVSEALKESYHYMIFNIQKMIIQSKCGNIFQFKCTRNYEATNERRGLYLKMVNGERYDPKLHGKFAEKVLNELFTAHCKERRGITIPPRVCDSAKKLKEMLDDLEINENLPKEPA